MSSAARRRLVRDFKRLQSDSPSGVTAAPNDNNILSWQAIIFGPDDTSWEGGTFKLELTFTEDYPNKASKLFSENRREYNRRVREVVEQSWDDGEGGDDDDDDDDDDDETWTGPAASTSTKPARSVLVRAFAPGRRRRGGRGKTAASAPS
ncbi:hypothetical protein JL720_14369 [Aureococcus anophagefferens]|nr:hypothetical protein JL720_14369 [Aureococcus anophagefferens]